jgi:arsenate reductase
VVAAMRDRGVDLSSQAPRRLTPELAATAGWLITMGCGDECPVVRGVRRDDWPIPDPKGQSVAAVNAIADDIDTRVRAFVTTEHLG